MRWNIFLLLPFVLSFLHHAAYGLNLKSLYEEAKKSNIALKDATIDVQIAQQKKKQLFASTLPTISLNASFIQLNQSHDFTNRGLDDTRETVSIRGVQQLFSGLKEFYVLQGANAHINAQQYKLKSQHLDLLAELSRLYFQIYLFQEKIINTQELILLSKDRENLLKQRVKIGKSRKSELRQAKVQTHLNQLNLQQYQLENENLWNQLSTFLGTKLVPEKLFSYFHAPITLQSLDYYVNKINDHPNVLAQNENLLSMQKQKNAWQSDYFPTISIISDYYALAAQNWAVNPEWDIGLMITYPFFEGGLTKARVSESALNVAKSNNQLSLVKNNLENQIKNVHQSIIVKQQQQKTIEEICQDNKNNYEEIKNEYSMGLVTNLDVATALNVYVESLNQKVENSIELQFNVILLKTLIGEEI